MWPASLRSVVPTVWPVGLFENYCKPLRGGMCHVPCATNRLMAGTIVVPAFWRVEWCHAGPDRTSRSGAIPENAWTHILTDWLTDRQTRPANYFSPTHQWKSSFIERSMLKHLNVHSLQFWIILNVISLWAMHWVSLNCTVLVSRARTENNGAIFLLHTLNKWRSQCLNCKNMSD